ncbi:hypothetical protein Tsubulata_049461, partial [Turnera subulata]
TDSYVLPSVVKACGGLSSLRAGKQVQLCVLLLCLGSMRILWLVLSSLFHMYVQLNRITEARRVFDRMPQPTRCVHLQCFALAICARGDTEEGILLCGVRDLGVELNLVSWNGMITGFNHSKRRLEAVVMIRRVHLEGFRPDEEAGLSSVLSAVGALEMLEEQDKEQILCGRSEKLAIVLGLLETSPGSTL